MSIPEITNTGITIQTYDEILQELIDGYKSIYGSDINVSQESPDGQRIAIEAKARLDMQSYALALYNSFDPDLATGLAIEKIAKLSGVYRRPATRSQVDLTVTTDRILTLESGYRVQDVLGQVWMTTSAAVLAIGVNTVTFFAENYGAVEASIGTITEHVDIVIGVLSITNAAAATVGIEEETDVEFRQKRNNSLALPSYSIIGSIFARLLNTANVTDVVVYENDTDVYDAVRDINAHTIWIVVEGGDVVDIAESIAKQKTGGTAMKGTVSQTYEETLIRPDGTPLIIPHIMKFDRPTIVDVYITVTATRIDTTSPIDTVAIATSLASYPFNIGKALQAGSLYSYGYLAGDNFVLTDLLISDDDITYIDGLLTPGLDEKYQILVANITVTEVV